MLERHFSSKPKARFVTGIKLLIPAVLLMCTLEPVGKVSFNELLKTYMLKVLKELLKIMTVVAFC